MSYIFCRYSERSTQLCIPAASETSASATLTFILAMLMHPDIQVKAQREIDSVVGSDRLPDFSDQSHLPYLAAVLKEVLRYVTSWLSRTA